MRQDRARKYHFWKSKSQAKKEKNNYRGIGTVFVNCYRFQSPPLPPPPNKNNSLEGKDGHDGNFFQHICFFEVN